MKISLAGILEVFIALWCIGRILANPSCTLGLFLGVLLWIFVMFLWRKMMIGKIPLECEVCRKRYRPFTPTTPYLIGWIRVVRDEPGALFGYICPSKECYQKHFSKPKKLPVGQEIRHIFAVLLYYYLWAGFLYVCSAII